jgi:hypothetical protein
MSNLFEHCRTAAKFAALRSNGEQKTVKVFASLQTEPPPSLRCCKIKTNEKQQRSLLLKSKNGSVLRHKTLPFL